MSSHGAGVVTTMTAPRLPLIAEEAPLVRPGATSGAEDQLFTSRTRRLSVLGEVLGVGPAGAARILADVGDVDRFANRNPFTSWTDTAPLDAASGQQIRHRLSRAGNRRMNHVIHVAAIVQLRHDTESRAYYRRKLAAGKTPRKRSLPQAPDLRRHLPVPRRGRPSHGRHPQARRDQRR
jgi:hypothetical protein